MTTLHAFEATTDSLMHEARVAGLAFAILEHGRIAHTGQIGWKNKDAGARLDDSTVFAAASLSKPVFAYLVAQLAAERVIDLDRPLWRYLPRPLAEVPEWSDLARDPRYRRITARMALGHTTGLPNLRPAPPARLRLLFDPGARFQYSGEGVRFLQFAVERITHQDLEALARDRVFRPLGMTRSSYRWREDFARDAAAPHNEFEWASEPNHPQRADAAGSLTTTARDYARFLAALQSATGVRARAVTAMLSPSVRVRSRHMFVAADSADALTGDAHHLAWGLGVGLFDSACGPAFFHTGHAAGAQNYVVMYRRDGNGVVLLSNSDNFESIAPRITAAAIGDTASPFDWLGYVPFDPARRRPVPPRLIAVPVGREVLAAYPGDYRIDSLEVTTHIKAVGDTLFDSDDGQSWDALSALSDSTFFFAGRTLTLTFRRDATGRVAGLSIDDGAMHLAARRLLK